MPAKRLKSFLDENNVKYVIISHSMHYTAQEIAAATHISGKKIAKTVMVKLDGKMAMCVLPAAYHINMDLLKEMSSARTVELATEDEFKDLFPECELGAMPPFGNLYSMDVYVGEILSYESEILFNAGSHTELVKMNYLDFEMLVKPIVIPMVEMRMAA